MAKIVSIASDPEGGMWGLGDNGSLYRMEWKKDTEKSSERKIAYKPNRWIRQPLSAE